MLTLAASSPRGASAQERAGVSFSWVRGVGADACPSADDVRTEVARRLGYEPFTTPTEIFLEGVVARADEQWTVRLYKRDGSGALLGDRELTNASEDCRALADAIILAVALAIDPEAAMRPTEPQSDAEPIASTQPAVDAPADADVSSSAADTASVRQSAAAAEPSHPPRLAFGGALSYDLVPELAYGFRIAIDAAITDSFRWWIDARYWPEQIAMLPGSKFGVGLTTASLGLCFGETFEPLRLEGCAGLDLGAMHVVVYDPIPSDPGDRVFVGASAALRFMVKLAHPIWLGVWAGASVPFIDYDLRVEGQPTPVFSSAPIAPLVALEMTAVLGRP